MSYLGSNEPMLSLEPVTLRGRSMHTASCQTHYQYFPFGSLLKLNHLPISLDQEGRPGHFSCWLFTLKISINVHPEPRVVLGQLQWVEHTGYVHSCVTHASQPSKKFDFLRPQIKLHFNLVLFLK